MSVQASSQVEPPAYNDSGENSIISRLIEAVQARPALWDHTLPVPMRARGIREKMWKEIERDLGFNLSIPELEKKWRGLKDTFIRKSMYGSS